MARALDSLSTWIADNKILLTQDVKKWVEDLTTAIRGSLGTIGELYGDAFRLLTGAGISESVANTMIKYGDGLGAPPVGAPFCERGTPLHHAGALWDFL